MRSGGAGRTFFLGVIDPCRRSIRGDGETRRSATAERTSFAVYEYEKRPAVPSEETSAGSRKSSPNMLAVFRLLKTLPVNDFVL